MGKLYKAIEKARKEESIGRAPAIKKGKTATPTTLETVLGSKLTKPIPVPAPSDVAHPPAMVSPLASPSSAKPHISLRYTKTKIQFHDSEDLKNNKIISLFDEYKPTHEIKLLQTQVLKKLKKVGGNSILVVSYNPYEGKTFTSINLGVSIAREFDRTVLIIDADLRKPSSRHCSFSTDFFRLDVEKGLSDYLAGNSEIQDILINPGINKFTVIPSGKPAVNAPELLNSDTMRLMMEDIKNRYPADRMVIIDTPPIAKFPDSLILANYVDGILIVVESERTTSEDLKKLAQLLKDAPVLGTVFNKAKD
jgi:non-specific protein-tyrosine kinase